MSFCHASYQTHLEGPTWSGALVIKMLSQTSYLPIFFRGKPGSVTKRNSSRSLHCDPNPPPGGAAIHVVAGYTWLHTWNQVSEDPGGGPRWHIGHCQSRAWVQLLEAQTSASFCCWWPACALQVPRCFLVFQAFKCWDGCGRKRWDWLKATNLCHTISWLIWPVEGTSHLFTGAINIAEAISVQ